MPLKVIALHIHHVGTAYTEILSQSVDQS